jgi:tetratricopeptide (TPR) repeat protein
MSPNIIDGRYKVIKTLAGGMGIVYLCLDLNQSDFPVALKTIKPDFLPNSDARSKFLREANIWIQLGFHPNIVHAYKVEYFPETHETFIVTEFIQTPQGLHDASLRSWILDGRIDLERVMNFGIQIIHGMKYATTQIPDLVHRDLKPENILIGPDETAKVSDFGISSSIMSDVPIESGIPKDNIKDKTRSAIGTLNYMSPEQIMAQPLDCRSDIYAYGLIIYELLCGIPAIDGQNDRQVIHSHLNGDALRRANENIRNVNLRTFVMRCVHPEVKVRYKDWAELEKALNSNYKLVLGKDPPENEYPIDISLYGFFQKAGSYLAIGASYVDAGDYGKAEVFTQKALEFSQKIASPRLEAAALSNLGLISSQQGLYDKAINYFSFSINISFKLYDLASHAINLGNMGGAYQRLGNIEKARDCFVQSLTLAKSDGLVGIQAAQLGNLAISFAEQGQFQKAISFYNKAIEILRDRNAEVALSTNYSNLANTYLLIGDLSSSEENLLKALELAVKNGVKQQQSVILGNLANVMIARGNLSRALELFSDATSISNEIGGQSSLCKNLAGIATIFTKQHKYKEAMEYFENALHIAEDLGDIHSEGDIQLGIGNLSVECGSLNEAVPAFEKSIEASRRINDSHTEASALGNLGKVYAALFHYDKAIPCLEKSIEIAKEIGLEAIQARATWTLGIILEIIGKIDEAINFMQYAIQIFRKYNLPEYEQATFHLREIRKIKDK